MGNEGIIKGSLGNESMMKWVDGDWRYVQVRRGGMKV